MLRGWLGAIVDGAVVLALLEWLVLGVRYRRTGRGLSGADLAGNLLSGIALLLALRDALRGAQPDRICLWLLLALVTHALDLRRRWLDKRIRTEPPVSDRGAADRHGK